MWNFFPQIVFLWNSGFPWIGKGALAGAKMQLNAIGLVGILFLLNLINSVGLDNFTATCLVLLCDSSKRRDAVRPRLSRKNPLLTHTDKQFWSEFRFAKHDIPRLVALLEWPPVMYTVNRVVYTSEICLMMVMYRFAHPTTMIKLEVAFGIHESACSNIVSHGVQLLNAKFGNRLKELDVTLVLLRLEMYQEAIRKKSRGAVNNCFGLIDGTLHRTCRPWGRGKRRYGIRNMNNIQRAVYSGHKRHHGLKFQSVVVPDGMIVQMFGPVEGRRHDTTLLRASNLDQSMQLLPPDAYIYGDQAYPVRRWLLSPYRGGNKTVHMRRWNMHMRTVRISVEHGFKILTTLWSHLKFVPAQRIFNSPLANHYVACTALTNLHNCLYPNQVAQHFGLIPPTLEEYVGMHL